MDGNFVHQRDMTTILANLEKSLEATAKEKVDNPEKENEMKEKLVNLLQTADTDIRLKTQTIVRYRLQNSKQLPISVIDNEYKSKMVVFHQNTPVIPKLTDDPPQEIIKPKRKRPGPKKEKIGLPLLRTPGEKTQNMQRSIPNQIKPNRPETAMHPPRKAITKPLKCKLPRYDFHDPGAPSPELPKKAVEEHGYQRLTEMKLVSEDELQTKLDSTLNIRPFTYDYTSL